MWTDQALLELLSIDIPIIQSPMAGAAGVELAVAVSEAGALGSLPCAMLSPQQIQDQASQLRKATTAPLHLNFFCHDAPGPAAHDHSRWLSRLSKFYGEYGLDSAQAQGKAGRAPFDDSLCEIAEEIKPEVASFHFGLPREDLVTRIKAVGAIVMSSATTVAEARWLAERGCDVIIAQGIEAGGHRGMFLSDDVHSQIGLFALLPQIVDAVDVPVVAAGAIASGRSIAAAMALGASGVQIGTAYLLSDESRISHLHRETLIASASDHTAITNLFSGRPARGLYNRLMREIGPLSADTPQFPLASAALGPLKKAAEAQGKADFSSLWSGQAGPLAQPGPAGEITQHLAQEALAVLSRLSGKNQ